MVVGTDLIHMMDPSGAPQNVNFDALVNDVMAVNRDYAEIYVEGINVGIAMAAQDTYYQCVVWSPGGAGIDGEARGAVPDVSNDHITVTNSGIYFVRWHVSIYSAQKNEFEIEVFVNNGTAGFPTTEAYRTTSVASAVGSVAGGGICDLSASDTVELWAERKDGLAVAKTLTFRQATLSIMQLA
jgi:hypothetical protein